MASVKLLRVERDGFGMYRNMADYNHSLWLDCGLDDSNSNKHPNPHDDFRITNFWFRQKGEECPFAFGSTQQFLQWVYDPEWRYKMQELGGELWVYEVGSGGCAIGGKQAIFNINSVLSKRAFPITSFDDSTLRPIIEEYLQS